MTTLKQIRDKKRKEISKNIENFSFKVALTDEQQDECFKEWLQQNQEERPCDSRMFGDSKYDAYWDGYERAYRELLEELEEKKQQ